ncbi:MAG: hypothetical protein WA628_23450, partial [Terriglobales bacterium]
GELREEKQVNNTRHSDPAERSVLMRLFYRNWRPTRLGRWVNRFMCWWSGLGLPPRFQAALEVDGRKSGRRSRSTSLSPAIWFVIVLPFRAVVRSQSAKISSWLYSANPAEAPAQLLCEKNPLLESDEVAGL